MKATTMAAQRPPLMWIAIAAALVLLQCFILYRDTHFGRLSGLIPWDDNAILDDALHRLALIARTSSILDLIRHFRELAPHSPIGDFQAGFGLMLFNGWIFGPYWLNAAWVFLALYIMGKALPSVPTSVFAILVIIVIAQSLSLEVFGAIKADYKAALFVALALLLLSEPAPDFAELSRFAGSALLSLAALCKLTAFYMPPALGFTVLAFEISAHVRAAKPADRVELAVTLRPMAIVRYLIEHQRRIAAQLVIVSLPYLLAFAWGGGGLIDYIRTTLNPIWMDGLTPMARAAFYLPGGIPLWGKLPWLLAFVVLPYLICCLIRKSAAALPVLAGLLVAAMFFVPLVVAKLSMPEFSTFFVGTILGTVLICVRGVAAQSSLGFGAMCAAAGLLALTATFGDWPRAREAVLRQPRESYERIVDQIVSLKRRENPIVCVAFEDIVAANHNLSLLHFAKTGEVLNTCRIDDPVGSAAFSGHVRAADFVVTLQPASTELQAGFEVDRRFAASQDLAGGDKAVASDAAMIKVASFPWKNGQLNLYRNASVTGVR